MNGLNEGDVFAQLTDLRNGLERDGYDLRIVDIESQVHLAIVAGDNVCEDCLVGKDLMVGYVVTALRDLDPAIASDDVRLDYPKDAAA